MKQRIRVVGIIRNEEGILILKRYRGRSEAPVFWELPTSKINFGEQPEEAITRTLSEEAGLTVKSVKLKDAITFLAPEGASRISNLYIIYEVEVIREEKPAPKGRYNAYKFIKDFTNNSVRLDEASLAVFEIAEGKVLPSHISPRAAANSVTIYADGASRGNPGPAGIGYHIVNIDGSTLEQGGEFIGFATSRVAEYYAMRNAIDRALELGLKSAHFIADSLMVINQLNGIFTVKNQDIMPIYQDIQNKLGQFDAVSFSHVSRSKNQVADREANRAIDRILTD